MPKSILYAHNTNDLLTLLKNNQGSKVVGGCTKLEEIPDRTVSTIAIPELCQISRHERYIDVGPGCTLSDLLEVGPNHLPAILYEALKSIANPIIRNMATIGGNICNDGNKLTLFAPLMALDARLEYKSASDTKTESIRSFKQVPEGYILSNIRIPLPDSDIAIFRRIGLEPYITQQSASFAFMATTDRNTLSSVRLAFAGPFTFASKDFENSMIGQRLPLTQKDLSDIEEKVADEFAKAATDQMISDVMKQQFFNLTRFSFEQLT